MIVARRLASGVALGAAVAATVVGACGRSGLTATADDQWRLACEDPGDHPAALAFNPSKLQELVLDPAADGALSPPGGAEPTRVVLPATFGRLGPLVSSTLRELTVRAAPKYIHKTPVTIPRDAFAKLTVLETLTLENVSLAEPALVLELPPSIKRISIVSCGLQSFSYEISGGEGNGLVHVDLHSNNLKEIPPVLYSLPPSTVKIDLRLNKFETITVPTGQRDALEQWFRKGVLDIDNPRPRTCPKGDLKKLQGVSQVFVVCVVNDDGQIEDRSLPHNGSSATFARLENGSVAGDADFAPGRVRPGESTATHPPSPISISTKAPPDTKTGKVAHNAKPAAVYVALVSVGAVVILLAVVFLVLAVIRRRKRRNLQHGDDGSECGGKPRGSLLTAVTDDLGGGPGQRRTRNESSDGVSSLPTFSNTNMTRQSSDSTTPMNTHRHSLYTTLETPGEKNHGYMMSKSLQSMTGVSHYSISSLEKESSSRDMNKSRLNSILLGLTTRQETILVNKQAFACFGELMESETGAAVIRCSPVNEPDSRLILKIFVEQDIRLAIREFRALLVMQGTSCKEYVSQMVAAEMEKTLEGLKCAVMVMEAGSATTFRHIMRGQIDRSQQLAMVQQLYRVVKAVDCLHGRQFIHGGLHLDTLSVHPVDEKLKFINMEHATRFGDLIQGYAAPAIEYLPPEMARHLLCGTDPNMATSPASPRRQDLHGDELYQVLRASPSFDIWCLGVFILKSYANCKTLDEFSGCESPADFQLRLADPSFSFESSLKLYIHHDDVQDLARMCLQRDPRKRPKMERVLSHRVFRVYDRLDESTTAVSFLSDLTRTMITNRESLPPTLWFFLPPNELGLDKTRTVDEWVADLTRFQHHQRHQSQFRTNELMFPLIFMCEDTHNVSTSCSNAGFHHTRYFVPASLLSLTMPLIQETTLFLEAKAILSEEPSRCIAEVSGLGSHRWGELMKFYRALEKMLLAPISSFSLLMLKPLQEMLATKDKESAQQVLEEVKCLVFSQEKRDHVLSLLDILKTMSVNASADRESLESNDADLDTTSSEGDQLARSWSGLRKCQLEVETSTSMPSTRWLCRHHAECLMEWET